MLSWWNWGSLASLTRRCMPIIGGVCGDAPAGLGCSSKVSATNLVMPPMLLPPVPMQHLGLCKDQGGSPWKLWSLGLQSLLCLWQPAGTLPALPLSGGTTWTGPIPTGTRAPARTHTHPRTQTHTHVFPWWASRPLHLLLHPCRAPGAGVRQPDLLPRAQHPQETRLMATQHPN